MDEDKVRQLREAEAGATENVPLSAVDAAAIFETVCDAGHEASWHFQPEREEMSTVKPPAHEVYVHGSIAGPEIAVLLAIAEGKRCELKVEPYMSRMVFR